MRGTANADSITPESRERTDSVRTEEFETTEALSVGLVMSLKEPRVVIFHPWSRIGAQAVTVLVESIDISPVPKKVSWLGCVVKVDEPSKVDEFVGDGGLGMLAVDLLKGRCSSELAFGDGWSSRLRTFADRGTAEAWLQSVTPATDTSTTIQGMASEGIDKTQPSDGKSKPADYNLLRQRLVESFQLSREQVAKDIEHALNEEVHSRPHESYQEKKELAKWVNSELRALGLAIRDPQTGKPCLLVGDPGNRPEQGRFLLDFVDSEGRRVHALTSVTLPYLKLMPDDLSRAPYGSRTTRTR